MFADVAGYASLTGADEKLALKLVDQLSRIVRPIISAYNGKEVKTIGAAFIVEFASAVEATRCAYVVQQALYSFNATQTRNQRIMLRIGIHVGDAASSNKDELADPVNVCSWIEKLSEPGGICISEQVYGGINDKLPDLKFESLGLQRMKSAAKGVEVFKVVMASHFEIEARSELRKSHADPLLQNRVAVLPFVNIGLEQTDEFFADGLTEELISRLSQTKDLRVIARSSVMNYKNMREKKVRDIATELGVSTIVEGSVRKSGNKVRVSVQVVNGLSEEHVWSSTYDRDLNDIFEIQADIASKVSESFSSNFSISALKQVQVPKEKDQTQNVTAYNYFLRARYLLYGETEPSYRQSLALFTRAIEEDRNFARAYVGRAECHLALAFFAGSPWMEKARMAEADAKAAIEIDPELADAHATMSKAMFALDEFGPAEEEARKAGELNPSLAEAFLILGHLQWGRGHVKEAIKLYETAYKLDPLKNENIQLLTELYFEAGRDADALNLLGDVENVLPQTTYAQLSMYYMTKNDFARANEYLEKFRLAGADKIFVMALEATLLARKGEKAKALELISWIEKMSGNASFNSGTIGEIYYLLGDMDKFFEYMNRAMDVHALPLGDIVNSPIYENARRDPRMQKLFERLDLKIDLTDV